MRKLLKLAGLLVAGFLIFVVVVALAFYHLVRSGEVRQHLISEIERHTDLKVELGEADIEFGRILGLTFSNMTVALGANMAPAMQAERVTARVALWPLLHRELVFYEVRIMKLDARLERDDRGRLPLLERMLKLAFLEQKNAQFSLDLRTIKIAQSKVTFTDAYSETIPGTTRLHDLALDLERSRPSLLRESVDRQAAAIGGDGPALRFDLSAIVERDDERGRWSGRGEVVFPGKKLELAGAWFDMQMRIGRMPLTFVQAYAKKLTAVKSLRGTISSQLRLRGYWPQSLRASGTIEMARLQVDAPDLFARPLDAGDPDVQLDVEWQPERWKISALRYRSRDLIWEAHGQLEEGGGQETRLRLDFTLQPVPVATFKKYVPTRWLSSQRVDSALQAVADGELRLHSAGVDGTLAEIRRTSEAGLSEALWFEAEVRNLTAQFPGGYAPLRALQGRISWDKRRFVFNRWSGYYGRSRVTNFEGSFDASPTKTGVLRGKASGEVDLGELGEQARGGPLLGPALKAVEALEGKGKFDLTLVWPVGGSARTEGKLTLEGARLRWDEHTLTQTRGDILWSPKEITADKVMALMDGSPIEIRAGLKNYAAKDAMFDLAVSSSGVKTGVISRPLLGTGSLDDPGIVRGAIRYRGLLHDKKTHRFTGDLELIDVQLATQILSQPLRRLSGKVSIDEAGIDLRNLKGLIAGSPASASGRWRYAEKPRLIFEFFAPEIDILHLINQVSPEITEFYSDLHAEGNIVLARGRLKNFEFADLRSQLVLNRRIWRFANLSARSGGGSVHGPLTIMDNSDVLGVSAAPVIQNVPLSAFLRWFDVPPPELSGMVNVTGRFDTTGNDDAERKRNLNGAFSLKIADGTIYRLRILVQLLNLLDLSRWFTLQPPDLAKQGIRFRAITGDFKVTRGVYTTENLLVDSDDLRMSGAGRIDVPKDEVDFLVALRPFAGIDAAITQIPLLGRGIAAIKNSFLVASFRIKGTIDEPAITPAPLGTLSEMLWGVLGIPKSLIPSVGDDKEASPEAPRGSTPPPSP